MAVESARGTINPLLSMTERSDGRLEDVGWGWAGRGERWSETDGAKLVKYGENGRRKGRIEYDRQVCKYCLPQLGIGSSEAHTYRI
jgi:hypothetical protein